ncbi:MAG: glycosyltransferase family 39 protein [Lentisphaerae bacterium]|nr:glycosyltransferase family 39 protein [Lentisphaerota bacterium]
MNFSALWGSKTFLQKFFIIFLIFSGLLWVLVPSTYHSSLHFDPAETLMWGSTFNPGNAKHPPMSGYMLYNFCRIFGFPNWAIFLLSQVCVTIGFIYVYKLARCFFDRDNSVIATLLITFYFFYNYETPKFNANIPHLLFVPMMCYYFFRGCSANKYHHWILLALSAAGACLSKYSAGILSVSFILYLIVNKDARKVLTTLKPYIGALLFCALMTPHIYHLIKTDFLVFNYISHGKAVKYSYFVQLLVFVAALIAPMLSMSAACFIFYWISEKKFPGFKLSITNPAALQYTICIIGGQAATLLLMGICGHRLLTIWTYPLYLCAGIFIISFYPGETSCRMKRVFALFCSLFAAILLIFPLIYYNCKSKYRYHIDKTVFRAAAENFYRERTGNDIPFISGDIWEASMLQNTFEYKIKAAPFTDPILTALHAETIRKHGALGITANPEAGSANIEKLFRNVSPQWQEMEIEYCARFGKPKKFKFYLAVIPPADVKELGSQK